MFIVFNILTLCGLAGSEGYGQRWSIKAAARTQTRASPSSAATS
jgi:hypothetical protein